MRVEELQVLISANADQFTNELRAIQSQLNTLGKNTDNVSGKIGGSFTGSIIKGQVVANILTNTIRGLAMGFGNLVKAVVKNGAEYSRLKVATETVAKNIGLTAVQVDGLRDSLIEANVYGTRAEEVIKTLALSGLVSMADGLSVIDARSGKTAYGVEALVLQMKDLAGTAGVDSATAINRLTKFIRTGQAEVAETITPIRRLNVIYAEWAEKNNTVVSAMTETQFALARMWEVTEQARKSWGAYANIFQSSSKAWESTGNVIRTLAELLGGYLEPILSVVSNAFFQFFAGLRKALIDNESGFRKWATQVAGFLVAVVRVIGTLLTRIPVIGKYFRELARFSIKPITNVGNAMEDTEDAVGGATGATKKLKKELQGLAGFDELNVLNQPDSGAGAGGVGGVSGGEGSGGGFEIPDISADVNAKADAVIDEWKKKWAKFKEDNKGLFDDLKYIWEEILVPFGNWFKENWVTIAKWALVIAGVILVFAGIVKVVTFVISVFGALSTIWGVLTTVAGVVMGVITTLAGILNLPVGVVVALIAIIGVLVWTIATHWNEIVAITKEAFSNFAKSISDSLKAIKKYFSDVWDALTNYISKWIGTKIAQFKYLWEMFKLGIRFAGAYAEMIFNNIQLYVRRMVDNIQNRIARLKVGFQTFFGNIVDAVKKPINNIIDAINRFLSTIRGIKIPVIAPNGINVPSIPRLARGGVIESPTLSVIGESGREVVMPLENNTEWITELADQISSRGGTSGQLVVKIGENKIYDKFIDFYNEKSLATNTNLINI